MAAVRTFVLPHYEAYPVQVALFKDVKNAEYLRSQLLAANPEFDYAFVDAAMILTPAPLLLATTLSLHAFLHSSPRTRTPHGELLYRLSPTSSIADAYRLFGITASTTSLIVVKLPIRADGSVDESMTRESVASHLGAVVEGESVQLGEEGEGLGSEAVVHRVKKVFKVGCAKGKGKGKGGEGKDDRRDIEAVVLGCMALKGQ